jgi:hypothetical protein
MAVAERLDPILRVVALGRQQAHDLECVGRRAMKSALSHDDILAGCEFRSSMSPPPFHCVVGDAEGWSGGAPVRSVTPARVALSAASSKQYPQHSDAASTICVYHRDAVTIAWSDRRRRKIRPPAVAPRRNRPCPDKLVAISAQLLESTPPIFQADAPIDPLDLEHSRPLD